MKYIDAEKLKAEIERRKVEWKALFDNGENTVAKECFYEDENILDIINSLQQEQPAKRGYKDCNGCEYNRLLKDQIGWQFRGCFGGDYKGKPIAEIELCPLKLAVQQEQPEVDLEKEYKTWWNSISGKINIEHMMEWYMHETARHFYELGKNSK